MSLLLFFLGLGGGAGGSGSAGDVYRGQVVDVDTGEPLVGVIAVFVWERDLYSPVTGRMRAEFHSVVEVITDAQGRFQVSAAAEESRGPFVEGLRRMDPVFFTPGYYLVHRVRSEGDAFQDPTVVYLKRAEQPRQAVEPLPLVPSFPYRRAPLLLKALNRERARLELSLIEPGDVRRR